MKAAKSWFQVVMALLPVLFFGGMFLYFDGFNRASYGLFDASLGPTRIGLGALTILFTLLFLWRLKVAATPPPPKASVKVSDGSIEEPKSDFDADAAMARYLARRNGTGSPAPRAASFGPADDRPLPGGFGRKGTLG